MRFSVIMASYLGDYRTAAKERDRKIIRAIDTVRCQSFLNWELIVIADGCQKTVDIVETIDDTRLKCILIDKSKMWSGTPRNTGLEASRGEYITYLDIDDVYGQHHLKTINEGLNGYDWVWFDDIRYSEATDEWYQNPCDINKVGQHGTSNICHKNLPVRWTYNGYAHDYYFINNLKYYKNFAKIPGGEYYVCHIPRSTIGKGYDL
jgi:glycosyltransferase involved in cell wall biosynthesis